jgi:hypothetical protein
MLKKFGNNKKNCFKVSISLLNIILHEEIFSFVVLFSFSFLFNKSFLIITCLIWLSINRDNSFEFNSIFNDNVVLK